jgi:hypothetical protein
MRIGNAATTASDIVKAKSSGEDPRATGGLVSNLPHPWVNKTKQHTHELEQTLTLLHSEWSKEIEPSRHS